MRKILTAFLLISSIFCFSSSAAAEVVAYYFHGDFRCPTCHKLEQYSKEAIETGFKDELASGKLEYKVVNVKDKGNEHFMNDYQLYTKSLILSSVKDGKETNIPLHRIKTIRKKRMIAFFGEKKLFFCSISSIIKN